MQIENDRVLLAFVAFSNSSFVMWTACTYVSGQTIFHTNLRLRMCEYCHSNLGAIYAKGLCTKHFLICLTFNFCWQVGSFQ